MTSTQTFRTDHSLLISYVDVVEQLSISSKGKFNLSSKLVKTTIRKSIKLNVHKGKLFVFFYEKNGKEKASIHRLEPAFAGMFLRFIHAKSLPLIESFLHEHFDTVEIREFNFLEKDYINEVTFHQKDLKYIEKESIAYLLAKLLAISFPIYINYIDNRVTDGYYSSFGYNVCGRSYFKAQNFRDFLIDIFGVYRKDLAKVAVKCNAVTLDWASRFKGLIDVNHMVTALRQDVNMTDGTEGSLDPIRHFPLSIIHKLFLDGLTNKDVDSIIINDALDMAGAIPAEEHKLCRTWKELHDRGVMHYVHDQTGYTEILHPKEFEDFFANADFTGRHIVPLRSSEDFIKTGKYMDVCVGSFSYIKRAIDGEGYCFRVDNEDKEKYALIEVTRNSQDKWNINQVKGHSNADIPKDFHKELFEQLSNYIPLESRK